MLKSKPIRVLIVDDSVVVRMILRELLQADPAIEVIATAEDPVDAREKIKQLKPDVITLDIEMPKMDGIQFLERIMRLRPMPVVMVSTLTAKGAEISLKALELGAVDLVHKPGQEAHHIESLAEELTAKVKMAATANLLAREIKTIQPAFDGSRLSASIIAIGASTGGTEAIKEALMEYTTAGPPVVVTQHIPPIFSTTYSQRLATTLGIPVTEVTETVKLEPGNIYLAQGDLHLTLRSKLGNIFATPDNSEKVNKHRPAVDVMFNSVSPLYKASAIGVLLTGMGADGALGLLRMRESGALTIAQDEATSVVWGMPRRAAELGAAKEILPLMSIQKTLGKINYKPLK